MQFLISGHVDDGLAAIRTVLEAVGMTLPSTPRRAARLVLDPPRPALVPWPRVPGKRDSSEVAAADLTRIDVCWSAARRPECGRHDRGPTSETRGSLLALRAGEPFRVARSLAMEAAQAAMPGVSAQASDRPAARPGRRSCRAVRQPPRSRSGHPARGVSAYLEGRWRATRKFPATRVKRSSAPSVRVLPGRSTRPTPSRSGRCPTLGEIR